MHAIIIAQPTEDRKMGIPSKLAKYIADREKLISKPWSPAPISRLFAELLANGQIEVGGRYNINQRVDQTWKIFVAWGDVVKQARKCGISITEGPMKRSDKPIPTCGGWWYSNIYRIERNLAS